MASAKQSTLMYKGHPLRRKDNLIYYGSMADKYIIMMQVLDTQPVKDLSLASIRIRCAADILNAPVHIPFYINDIGLVQYLEHLPLHILAHFFS